MDCINTLSAQGISSISKVALGGSLSHMVRPCILLMEDMNL